MIKKVYKVNYWLKNIEGEVVDTSEGGEPMRIVVGEPDTIEGLQEAVSGRSVGDRIDVTIPPELAYGPHNPDFVTEVDPVLFDLDTLQPGMKFQTNTGDATQIVKVLEVHQDRVVVDANHPLAGLTLNFEIEIISIEDLES
jgi:FKBP-type peptidyl-prolyl cis-trans isomerase SlyD